MKHGNLTSGLCYLEGTGVMKDEKLAFQLIKLGAEKGDVVAMVNAALLSTNGCGTPVDFQLGMFPLHFIHLDCAFSYFRSLFKICENIL